MSRGWIVQGVGPQGSVRAIWMRSQVSMMMVNAPGIDVGLLLGRALTRRKAILNVWGQMSPWTRLQITGLDSTEADLRATARHIMHTCFHAACHEWARKTIPADLEDWNIGMYYSIPA